MTGGVFIHLSPQKPMKKFKVVESKRVTHTYIVEAHNIEHCLMEVKKYLSSMNKSPFTKVDTEVDVPVIDSIQLLREKD